VGPSARPALTRAASALAVAAVVALPFQGTRTIESSALDGSEVNVAADDHTRAPSPDVTTDVLRPDMPLPEIFADNDTRVTFVAPAEIGRAHV